MQNFNRYPDYMPIIRYPSISLSSHLKVNFAQILKNLQIFL
jgi:hypothetical protein